MNCNYGKLIFSIDKSIRFKSCNDKILHGVYDMGFEHVHQLFKLKNGNIGVLEIHESLNRGFEPIRILTCGLSSHRDSLVLDSWNITQWIQ